MRITAKDLQDYRHIDRVIVIWQKNVDELREKANVELVDKVTGSNPEYPYNEQSFKVRGVDDNNAEAYKYAKRLHAAENNLKRFREIKRVVEEIREQLTDPKDKLIFEYTLKGTPQTVIADLLVISQTNVSERLAKILKDYAPLE